MSTMTMFRYTALLSAVLLIIGCKRDRPGGVPLTPVDISINVNNPAYVDLAVPGGWLYLTGGSLGLIVYRRSPEEFIAMDRHCPYQPEELCRVFVDDSEVIARDTLCCGSAFLITDGSVTQGPAALSLQRYNTTFNGTTLRIYN
jgi:nitrite reductase/ring-hydroxylating ferredoxin subunit